MSEPEPAVRTRGLVREFDGRRAVDHLDLVVRPGECLGLLGPNGAGKSTTVRILSTLLRPTAGEVRVLGLDPLAQAADVRARIGVVPQEVALYGHLTGRENLRFFARLLARGRRPGGASVEGAVARGLALAGLEDRADEPVRRYSSGMKRRLNVAAALLGDPELVFLDEPTVGIDPQSRNRILEMVRELGAAGTTVVYTSHQLGEVERLCDRIVVLDRGREVASGTLRELQEHPSVTRGGGAHLLFATVEEARRAAALLRAGSIACEIEAVRPDLEQVFLDLTGHTLRDEVSA